MNVNTDLSFLTLVMQASLVVQNVLDWKNLNENRLNDLAQLEKQLSETPRCGAGPMLIKPLLLSSLSSLAASDCLQEICTKGSPKQRRANKNGARRSGE